MCAPWGRSSGRQNGARWSSHSFRVDSVSETVNPAAMDAPVSVRLSTLQLWMLQCQWDCQPCSYGCSSVSETVNPAAMDAPVSVTLSTLQLWMLQCQWDCQPCSYGCSSVSDTVNPAAMDAPVSVIDNTADMDAPVFKDLSMMYRALWDQRHEESTRISQCTRCVPWQPPQPCYSWKTVNSTTMEYVSVSDAVNLTTMDVLFSLTLKTLQQWMLQCDDGASIATGLKLTSEYP